MSEIDVLLADMLDPQLEDENAGEIHQEDINEDGNDEAGERNDDGDGGRKEIKLETKKSKVSRPRNTLNVDKVKGPRGVLDLENYFKGIKFHGKGREKEDLDNIMKKMEHWAYRLYPKYNLDDTISVIENMGKKSAIHSFMHKYRMGMLENLAPDTEMVDDDPIEYPDHMLNIALDPLDSMLDEQIAKSRGHLDVSGISNLSRTRDEQQDRDFSMLRDEIPTPPPPAPAKEKSKSPPKLTDEDRARIAANRLKALELIKARKAAKEQELAVDQSPEI